MILTIRTDKPVSEVGLYEDGKLLAYEKWEAHRQLAETLHKKVLGLLKSQGLDWSELQGIVAYEGPGSFTGLRIGISVANALSYSLNIPIVGVQSEDFVFKGIQLLNEGTSNLPVTPFYGADANITTPKK